MKLRSGSLSKAASILAFLVFSLSLRATAAKKGNSDYGINSAEITGTGAFDLSAHTSLPGFTVNNLPAGITMSLNSVWCTSTQSFDLTQPLPPPSCPGNAFDYLIDITISSGVQLSSLTFHPPTGTILNDFGIVLFALVATPPNPTTGDPGDTNCGTDPTANTCPETDFSDPSFKSFPNLTITVSPNSPNSVSFSGFNSTALAGSGKIVFYVTATGIPDATGVLTPGALSVDASGSSLTPPPAPRPLASSYKSIINIRNLFHGNKTCPAGWSAVGDTGDGDDSFGTTLNLSEQFCANPVTGEFFGDFTISHTASDTYFGVFNGTFVPSGNIIEVHATWRITGGKGQFSGLRGAGTGKGTASNLNGAPGPGTVLLDGSVATSKEHESK